MRGRQRQLRWWGGSSGALLGSTPGGQDWGGRADALPGWVGSLGARSTLLGQGTPVVALGLCACSRWDPEGCPLTKALRMPEEVTFSAPSLLGRTGGLGICALDT